MPTFPERFKIKRFERRSASDSNSGPYGVNMPGNTGSVPGNWPAAPAAAALPAPPLIVINPPQDTLSQVMLLVTAVVWTFALWSNRTSSKRT
ncbi:hypothetical protein SLV14_003900 [Streptomyces sp. Je 1-4]|uniref:hypothetical protein n=1 Tax=Streptomyces TaxID=1883 RepID=UPI0021D91D22|nr:MULTISPECIES: hypothetical protein [unclassified Streptomyces]UYB41186.1 hypothetical protein SLV14_003900 [Streptomyces sp. Je 1-4]UZQ37364.1 hypothetical protein SLV14N_003900 [Streptomyces sp. Je 1-4] [Streptomyces sp. Je 1-4 4N24]UZQ44781.1 hypothetical protein SLV14NA_003900 [Streptomyces sp. Je 1-4] [Streptomyces sp. Je 1-4 4N24_ara]